MTRILLMAAPLVLILRVFLPMPSDADQPYYQWHGDNVQILSASDGWVDRIGSPVFETDGFSASWDGNIVAIAITTNMPNRNIPSAGRHVSPADLALDMDGDGVFETAVIMSNIRETGDRNVARAPTVARGQVYAVTRWHRPADLLQDTYATAWRWHGSESRSHVPVWMAEGEVSENMRADVVWATAPDGGRVVHVTIIGAGRGFALLWGTAVCGNDVIAATLHRPTRTLSPAPAINLSPPHYLAQYAAPLYWRANDDPEGGGSPVQVSEPGAWSIMLAGALAWGALRRR